MDWWKKLQSQSPELISRVRTAILLMGLLGATEAHNIALELAWPSSEVWLRRVFVICAGLSVLLRAGDKTTPEKVQAALDAPNDKGFIKPYVALTLLAVCLCCAVLLTPRSAHAQGTLADVAASDLPTPSRYGGCFHIGKIASCAAPEASITLAAINFSTSKVEGAFAPGIGYGLRLWAGQWYAAGLSLHGSIDPGAQRVSAGFLLSLFNGYVSLGLDKEFVTHHDLRLPYAVAASF